MTKDTAVVPADTTSTLATELWTKKCDRYGDTNPRVSVWMPSSVPYARLQTTAHGCNEPDTLPEGPATAYITIAGVQYGGYLDELELLFDAVREQLANVRAYYNELKSTSEKDN